MKITIPGPAVVRYEPVEQNAFRVTIRDPAGNLVAAGFRNGDLIIGIDGTEFETAMQARSALMAAMSKDASKLTILRGGARHTLSVDFKKLMESGWNKMGGKLDPASR